MYSDWHMYHSCSAHVRNHILAGATDVHYDPTHLYPTPARVCICIHQKAYSGKMHAYSGKMHTYSDLDTIPRPCRGLCQQTYHPIRDAVDYPHYGGTLIYYIYGNNPVACL
jgi:hypothetical protein